MEKENPMSRHEELNAKLDEAIDNLLDEMSCYEGHTEQYKQLSERLEELTKLRDRKAKFPVSPDVMFAAGANILGMILIMRFERLNIITTKAFTFLARVR